MKARNTRHKGESTGMKNLGNDVLNAIVTDVVADQVCRALELGFSVDEVENAVRMGRGHGIYEHGTMEKLHSRMEKTIEAGGIPCTQPGCGAPLKAHGEDGICKETGCQRFNG